jgi:hypothetical protein
MVEQKLKRLIAIFSIVFIVTTVISAQEKLLNVVPLPKEYRFLDGNFSLDNGIVVKKFLDENESVSLVLKEIETVYSTIYSKELYSTDSGSELIFGIPSKNKSFKKLCEVISILPSNDIGDEGYMMLIENNRIFISANSVKGIFYGLQSLKQLIKGSAGSGLIPNVIIKDYPSFKFRSVMDDISRGPIPTLEFMKKQIRRLAELKVNGFSHYVEHVVKTKKHPGIAPDDGSLTIEEWKEISNYAKKYFITVFGSFQSFGHFQSILKNPDYAHLGESGTLISPVKEESYKFLNDIYDEMIPAFDAPFFNINCDETFDLGKAESKKLVDSIGYDGVYIQHVTRLNKYIKAHGIRTLIWGDIILDYPNILDKLPKDMIVGTWNYDDNENFEKFLKPFKNSGREFMISPGVLNSNRIFPDFHKAFGNIKKFISEGKEAGAFGVMNCVWDDGGTALFTNDWLGVAYGAEKSWNHNSDDSLFDLRYLQTTYASKDNSITKVVWKLNELGALESSDGMTDKIIFANLVPDAGKETRISLVDWKEVIEIIDEAQLLLNDTELLFYREDKEYLQFIIDLYRTLADERFTLIEAASLYTEAVKNYSNGVFDSRRMILSSMEKINNLIFKISYIKYSFERLWLKENHTYSLDLVFSKYQAKIDDYVDIKSRLFESLKKLDSGKEISPIRDVRLGITKLPGKYFREWMMVNPLPNKDNSKTSAVDYLIERGGELNAEPKVAEEFYFDSLKYRWRRVVTEYQDTVNLAEIFPDKNKNSVVYAFANIFSDEEILVNALVGGDDGVELILNGNSIYKFEKVPGNPGMEQLIKIPLRKGKNNLLLKISQTDGDWNFTFRLPDSQVRNSKNRYRVITSERL